MILSMNLKTQLSKIKPEHWIIIGCLMLASLFIFDHLGARTMWVDEAGVANTAELPFNQAYLMAFQDGHLIAHVYFTKILSLILGTSEIAYRSFSILFALALIILLYKTAKLIFADKKTALSAAILGSTNYFLIWFASQIRPYTLAAFSGLLSFYFFIKLTQTASKKYYIAYALVTLIGLYTHPWLFLVLASQILTTLFFSKQIKNYFKILFSAGAALVLALPYVAVMLYQGQLGTTAWLGKPENLAILKSFRYLSYGENYVYLILILIAIFFIISNHSEFKNHFSKNKIALTALSLYLFFPLIAAFIISQFKPAYLLGRYEMIVLPAFILIAAYLWSQIKNNYLALLFIPLLVFFAAKNVVINSNFVNSQAANDKTVTAYVLANINQDDTVIATDLSWHTFYYYQKKLNHDKKFNLITYPDEIKNHPCWKNTEQMLNHQEQYQTEAKNLIASLVNKSATIWVLYKVGNPINEILLQELNENFMLAGAYTPPPPKQPMWLDIVLVYKTK